MIVKFDRTCPAWVDDPRYRIMFIRQQQIHFEDLLKVRGYVTIVEVLNALTIPFDIDSYLNRPLSELAWLRGRCDKVIIQIWDELVDGTIMLRINID